MTRSESPPPDLWPGSDDDNTSFAFVDESLLDSDDESFKWDNADTPLRPITGSVPPPINSKIRPYNVLLNESEPLTKVEKWKKRGMQTLSILGNGFYSTTVSLLFAAFAYRRGEGNVPLGFFYGTTSFTLNTPMSWFYLESTVNTIKRIVQKKEKAFIASAFLAFVLAGLTTAAGFQVAIQSVEGLESFPGLGFLKSDNIYVVGIRWLLTAFSLFNTFSTRFVGATYFIFSLWKWGKGLVLRHLSHSAAHYHFLDDHKKYGYIMANEDSHSLVRDGRKTDEQYLNLYVQRFYAKLKEKNIKPWSQAGKNLAMYVITAAILSVFIVNMMPLWIMLTVGGTRKFSETLSENPAFILFSAASSELFYLNSGRQFIFNLAKAVENGYYNAKDKLKEAGKSKFVTFGLAAFFVVSTWAVFSYFSGTGYGEDGHKAMQEGFGDMADKLWFQVPVLGWWTKLFLPVYPNLISTVSAGSIINGGSAIGFCLTRVSFFQEKLEPVDQFGPQKAQAAIEAAVDADNFDEELRDTIENRRGTSAPSIWKEGRSFWRSCRERATREERMSLSQRAGSRV